MMTGHGKVKALEESQSKRISKLEDAVKWLLAIVGEGTEPLQHEGIRNHYENLCEEWDITH